MARDQKRKQEINGQRRYNAHIDSGDRLSVIFQKSLPSLRRRILTTHRVFRHHRLGHSKPSIRSSPRIRDAPHSALFLLIRRIRSCRSRSIFGRPALFRGFQREYAAWPEIERFSLLFVSRFPVLPKSFPVIFHRVFSLETRMDAGFIDDLGTNFRPNLPFSLYFSLFFGNLQTGSRSTASATI